ncbi:MAG: 23S rRNA (adenine(2503)-C(2))-methyltransferase RlmN [Anaerolineae bacterium]
MSSDAGAELRDFFALSRDDLAAEFQEQGQPRYRADQVWTWVYRQRVDSFEAMSNLPSLLRHHLTATYSLTAATLAATVSDSASFTRKDLLRLHDGEAIEAVLMAEPEWYTVCVSTQVGCPMACTICATGQAGLHRNLTAGEIVYQVLHFARHLTATKSEVAIENVVFMGMGEPLLNFEAVTDAIARLCDPYGLALNPHNITVSTVGLPQPILALARLPYAVRLAVSLHGATQAARARLVPVAARVPLPELMAAVREYARIRDDRVTFEYVLVDGVNDGPADADALVSLIGDIPSHVNLIPLNPVAGCDLRPAGPLATEHFRARLKRSRIPCTMRFSRGVNIGAGCGQLRGAQD